MAPRTEAQLQFEVVATIWMRLRGDLFPIHYPKTTKPVVDHARRKRLVDLGRLHFALTTEEINSIRRRVYLHLRRIERSHSALITQPTND
jgi:hypothetical protein